MSKLYFVILCWFENIKAAIHCWRCGFDLRGIGTRCEYVNLREALYLLDAGFTPASVDYQNDGENDTFWFKRTAELLKALSDYRKAVYGTTDVMEYGDLTKVCDIPGSRISPIDDEALENVVAPRGHVREAFAYATWAKGARRAYVGTDAITRKSMVDDTYKGKNYDA